MTSQNPNQLLEPQTEQEFTELLHSYSNSSSGINANQNISEEDLPPPPATPQMTLLDSTITPQRTPLTPTLGLALRVRDNTQPGTKDLARGIQPVESPESPTDPVTVLVQEQGRSGGATRELRKLGTARPPCQGEKIK